MTPDFDILSISVVLGTFHIQVASGTSGSCLCASELPDVGYRPLHITYGLLHNSRIPEKCHFRLPSGSKMTSRMPDFSADAES